MKRRLVPLLLILAASLAGCLSTTLNPRDSYVKMLQRNNCPVESLDQGVNEQTCKLAPRDERMLEMWRREAIPSDCKSQWNICGNIDPQYCHEDPCWAKERARQKQWDLDHHTRIHWWEYGFDWILW
jgi:hypothetical protein